MKLGSGKIWINPEGEYCYRETDLKEVLHHLIEKEFKLPRLKAVIKKTVFENTNPYAERNISHGRACDERIRAIQVIKKHFPFMEEKKE